MRVIESENVKTYYDMLRQIPVEERNKRGLSDQYLAKAEKMELAILKEARVD